MLKYHILAVEPGRSELQLWCKGSRDITKCTDNFCWWRSLLIISFSFIAAKLERTLKSKTESQVNLTLLQIFSGNRTLKLWEGLGK